MGPWLYKLHWVTNSGTPEWLSTWGSGDSPILYCLKGEVHPKNDNFASRSVQGLSRMVKVRGACDKPLWIYKWLNNCAAPAPDSDDVLVVASLAYPAHKNTSSSTTKMSSLSGAGRRNYSITYISKSGLSHAPRTFTIRLRPRTLQYMKISFLGELPL